MNDSTTPDQRVTAAREYITYARKVSVAELPQLAVMRLAAELRRQLGQVLDYIAEGETGSEAARLAAIRAVLAGFDWEYHDRQLALEEIERIAGAEASMPAPALTDAQRAVLGQALHDAIAWHEDPEPCGSCEYQAPALCAEHAEAVRQRDAYIKLSRELGIEVRP